MSLWDLGVGFCSLDLECPPVTQLRSWWHCWEVSSFQRNWVPGELALKGGPLSPFSLPLLLFLPVLLFSSPLLSPFLLSSAALSFPLVLPSLPAFFLDDMRQAAFLNHILLSLCLCQTNASRQCVADHGQKPEIMHHSRVFFLSVDFLRYFPTSTGS